VTEKINSEHKQEEPLFRRFVLSSSLFTAEMRMCEGDVLSVKDLSLSAFVTKLIISKVTYFLSASPPAVEQRVT